MSDTTLSVPPSGRPHAALLVCHMPLRMRQMLSEELEASMGLHTAQSVAKSQGGRGMRLKLTQRRRPDGNLEILADWPSGPYPRGINNFTTGLLDISVHSSVHRAWGSTSTRQAYHLFLQTSERDFQLPQNLLHILAQRALSMFYSLTRLIFRKDMGEDAADSAPMCWTSLLLEVWFKVSFFSSMNVSM